MRLSGCVSALLVCCIHESQSFMNPLPRSVRVGSAKAPSLMELGADVTRKRPRSKVSDPAGPTPPEEYGEPDEIDPDDIEELRQITNDADIPRPIPHQPWRLGDTAGCEAPIDSDWRQEAEGLIKMSVDVVGGKVLDVTWFLTAVLVTLDEQVMPPRDLLKSRGPEIEILNPRPPMWEDPEDPDPEPIWGDEEEVVYQRETEEEAAEAEVKKHNRYAPRDSDDPPDEDHIPDVTDEDDIPQYMPVETRHDTAFAFAEKRRLRYEEQEVRLEGDTLDVDTAGLSTIAQAIMDALETREEELQILARHELVLSSPGPPDVLETQKQFDSFRGADVVVQTQDPFESNRTLKGKLVDRNSMDLMINKQGRLVTIPLNFVACVRLPTHEVEGLTNDMDELEEGIVEAEEE